MTIASNLGFPRMGQHRELKKSLEAFWAGKISEADLQKTASDLRSKNWLDQKARGIQHIPSNDFALYDQILDAAELLGAVPKRYQSLDGVKRYFAMARGHQAQGVDVPALEMTKWFDTNYHYLVPELSESDSFALSSRKPMDHFNEAKALGVNTRPVIIGPVSFLILAKKEGAQLLRLLDRLLPVYEDLLSQLSGAEWVQIDEPCLVLDLSVEARSAFQRAYDRLAKVSSSPKKLIATYFGALGDNLELACSLPVQGLHIDLVRAPEQLEAVSKRLPKDLYLSAGVVDGRNVWKNDLDQSLGLLQKIAEIRGTDKLIVAPSCSLLHSPVDSSTEIKLDAEIKSWLAFATDKLGEVAVLAKALDAGHTDFPEFDSSRTTLKSRAASPRVNNPTVQSRVKALTPVMSKRQSAYPSRREAQLILNLPPLPTTTIGSFPQTADVRSMRASFKNGKTDQKTYNTFVANQIQEAVKWQEELGIDVLVHGEFERNDMVEYFGEQLDGFAFTENGWVQSYGSRCVKPPIIYGDVSRPKPMTVEWSRYAQSLTKSPMKGMLTGPVTILQWSFVRADQPRSTTCQQIAFAIRDEVSDLESAGLRVIQIDEPAIREGLPLRRSEWKSYLQWAVECFRISASSVADSTQIHTHMCYSEFNDIIEAVGDMDADAVSIETSRSKMELLGAFADYKYPNEVGPGVYDIHSPRIPTEDEMVDLLRAAAKVLNANQLWVNPDCGLKTRAWAEVRPALQSMVQAAKRVRAEL
ncbi:MAG: 5-methyltetrahydropteroyltriglutamate--homocysteine S-methyltransferase [Proteobacteria bacterium]|nr:MAG: 5-methyltetrahydropteroyltriglutamate--homocysteine S-methyltransferase [Pseudomonadota bacterium]